MTNYNNKGDKRRFGGNNGRSKSFGDNAKKPSFFKRGRDDNRSSDRQIMMHQAICGECGKMCQVPFRPNDEKPVYCKNCFENKEGNTNRNQFSRKDFNAHARPAFDARRSDDAVLKQLEAVNAKLERLIKVVGDFVLSKPIGTKEELKKEGLKEVLAAVTKKNSKKKTSKK